MRSKKQIRSSSWAEEKPRPGPSTAFLVLKLSLGAAVLVLLKTEESRLWGMCFNDCNYPR